MVNRVQSKFQTVGNSEFVKYVMQMILDGLLADEQLFADFAISKTLRHKLHDFFFAVAQKRLFAALTGLGRLLEGINHFRRHAVIGQA